MEDFITLFWLRDHFNSQNPFRHNPPTDSFLWAETETMRTWALWPDAKQDKVLIPDEIKLTDPNFIDRFPWHMEFVERSDHYEGDIWRRGLLKD